MKRRTRTQRNRTLTKVLAGRIANYRNVGLCAIGIFSGCIFSAIVRGDDVLELRPPLNSTLTIRKAETNWEPRPKGPPEAKILEKTRKAKAIEAIPASSPLDRFRGSNASLPAGGGLVQPPARMPEQTRALTNEPSNAGDIQPNRLPPPARKGSASSLPPLPSNATWQSRPSADRTRRAESYGTRTPSTAAPAPAVIAPSTAPPSGGRSAPLAMEDQFRGPIEEGNWVARDAINRIEPLLDPGMRQPASPVDSSEPKSTAPKFTAPRQLSQPQAASKPAQTTRMPHTKAPEAIKPATAPSETKPTGQIAIGESRPAPAPPKSLTLGGPPRTVNPKADASPAVTESAELEPALKTDTSSDRQQWTERMLREIAEPAASELQPSPLRRSETKLAGPELAEHELTQPQRSVRKQVEAINKDQSVTESPSREDVDETLPQRNDVQRNDVQPKREQRNRSLTPQTQSKSVDAKTSSSKTRSSSSRKQPAQATIGDLPELPAPSTQQLDYTGNPTSGVTPNRTSASFRRGIERTLAYFYNRPEVANGRSNWGMMHAMMVFGSDTQIAVGRKRHSAIAWIAGNNNCRGQRLLTHDASGIQAKSGVGLQGHQGQFLAVLGMCEVPSDYPLYAGQIAYSVADLIEAEKLACEPAAELTFTLIGLSHYLDTDATWQAADGTRWDFERLIEEELKQPIVGAACGGTHRLMGYAHALRKRRAEGKPITGQWKRAEVYTQDFINYAYSLQNRDGSMSTDWFEGRAEKQDVDRKIQTTGHIVEWLLTVTPDDQLQNRRLQAAVGFLTRSLASELDREWAIGPKGHALRSLAMFHQRVFKAGTPWIPAQTARASNTRRR
ncbi:MAG: hypothetical protein AAFV88_00150 [Planctomycetota bacterium]